MYKSFILGVLFLVFLIVLFLASDMKNAYKILPGPTSGEMPNPGLFADWRLFEPASKDFKVDLPAIPQSAKQTVVIPNTDKKRRYEMYASEKMNGSLFMVNLITYPNDIDTSNHEEIIRGMMDELMLGNPDNHLANFEKTEFKNHEAFNFNIQNEQYDIQGKAFMVEKVLYLLFYASHQGNFNKADFQHFLDSFSLNPVSLNNKN